MSSYQELDTKLTGRCSQRRKLANNTYAERHNGTIAIRLHGTDVLTFQPTGAIMVHTGGWKTNTTKNRLNEWLPHGLYVSQERGQWYWGRYANGQHERLGVFNDGDTVAFDGTVDCKRDVDKEQKALAKQIRAYAALCADRLPLAAPSGGDCWHCCMQVDGKSLGDATGNTDHLASHMEEGYIVPSLVYRALNEAGNGQLIVAAAFGQADVAVAFARARVKKAVAKYLKRHFGLPC